MLPASEVLLRAPERHVDGHAARLRRRGVGDELLPLGRSTDKALSVLGFRVSAVSALF